MNETDAEFAELVEATNSSVAERIAQLECERDEVRRLADAVADKAKALVARWDQPSWKDATPTAGFIYDLRNAVAAYEKNVH